MGQNKANSRKTEENWGKLRKIEENGAEKALIDRRPKKSQITKSAAFQNVEKKLRSKNLWKIAQKKLWKKIRKTLKKNLKNFGKLRETLRNVEKRW